MNQMTTAALAVLTIAAGVVATLIVLDTRSSPTRDDASSLGDFRAPVAPVEPRAAKPDLSAHEALEVLGQAPDHNDRDHYLRIVSKAADLRSVETLVALLKRAPLEARPHYFATILSLSRKDPASVLEEVLSVSLPPQGYGAVALVCHAAMPNSIADRLSELLHSAPRAAHPALVAALGRCEAKEHEGAILKCLAESSPRSTLRRACYLALGSLQTPRATIAILHAFDTDRGNRSILARARHGIRDRGAIREAAKQWDAYGQHGRAALLQSWHKDLRDVARRALQDPTPAVRVAAIRMTRSREDAPALLARMSKEHDGRIRRTILDTLRSIGTKETARECLELVDELPQRDRLAYRRAFEHQLRSQAHRNDHSHHN